MPTPQKNIAKIKNIELNLELNVEINPAVASLVAITAQDWQNWFQIWLDLRVAKTVISATNYEVSLLLTGDAEIQALNLQFRRHDSPTDVLAFAALEAEIPHFFDDEFTDESQDEFIDESQDEFMDESQNEYIEPTYLGDIVISVSTAQIQASEQKHSLHQELIWLAAHGFLHLLGWDHPDDKSLEEMLAQQDSLIQAICVAT